MSSTIAVCLVLFAVLSTVSSVHYSAYDTGFEEGKTCADVEYNISGVYPIRPQYGIRSHFMVFCDQEYSDGGWTVIQNRFDGSVDFYRGWEEYEHGFGDLQGEFWLGLGKIHQLTGSRKHELHVILEDLENVIMVATYSYFLISGPGEKYKLRNLGTYNGTAGDSLSYSLNQRFSTMDQGSSCATSFKSGWWFNSCSRSNLNGMYLPGKRTEWALMVSWETFKGLNYGLKRSRMLIRPVRGE